jgi:hypothetical protein
MLSLPVVNKSNVVQSLETFVEGDLLDHENKYWCDRCSKKVAALKRCCLHDERLPSCLILHLKRLEFDFDSMRKVKVNSFFSFPYRAGDYLNVEPFTQSGLARAEAAAQGKPVPPAVHRPEGFYEYELVAVLVHGGSAEGGHYITVCKGEFGRSSSCASSDAADGSSPSSKFFEFNDQSVRPFDLADIPSLCFGGVEVIDSYDRTTGITVQKEIPSRRNAYMCIYERRWKPPMDEEQQQTQVQNQEVLTPKVDHSADDGLPSLPNGLTPASSSRDVSPAPAQSVSPSARRSPRPIPSFDRKRVDLASFPPAVVQHVWESNLAFLHDKYALDSSTNWFLFNVLQLHVQRDGNDAPVALRPDWGAAHEVQLAQLGVFFVLKLLVRSSDNASFPQWIEFLYQLFDRSAAAREWFLGYLLEGSLLDDARVAAGAPLTVDASSPSSSGSALFVTLLFECPVQVVREAFVDLVVLVVAAHREDPKEQEKYFDEWPEEWPGPMAPENKKPAPAVEQGDQEAAAKEEGKEHDAPEAAAETADLSPRAAAAAHPSASSAGRSPPPAYRPASRIARLLQYLLLWIPRVRVHHRSYREFWHLLFHLARLGQSERRWLIGQGALQLLVEQFYMDSHPFIGFNVSPAYGQEAPIRKHVTQGYWPLQLISLLIRSASVTPHTIAARMPVRVLLWRWHIGSSICFLLAVMFPVVKATR